MKRNDTSNMPYLDFKAALILKYRISEGYVDMLISKKRQPKRGVGVLVLEDLEKINDFVKSLL